MEEELVIKSLTDEDIVVIVTRDKESMNPIILGENTTFDEFKREVLNVSQLPDIHMLYIDEEGDAVCLDCEDEFLEAWKLATDTKQLNVLVEPVVKKPHQPRPLSPPRFHHPKPYSYLSKVIGDERRKKAEEAARALLGKPKCRDNPKPVMFGEEPQPVWLGEDPEPAWFKNAMRKHTYKVIDSVKKSLDGAVIASIREKSLIPTPLKGLGNTVIHHGIVCDVCDNTIVGIRYKCGNCVDYDLCESCEENSQFLHYEDHVFLKMRRPLQYAGLNRKGKRKPLLKRNIYHPMILPFNPNPLEEEAIAVLKTTSESKEKPLETLLSDKGKKEGMVRRSKERLREDLRRNKYHKKHHKYEETRREPEASVEMIKKSKVQLRHELYAAKQQKKLEKTLHDDESHDIPTHHDESHDIIPTHHDESHDITSTHHEKSNDIKSSLKGHGKCLDAMFVSDTSYSDDAIISYGNAFKKGWIIENTGTKTWKRVKLVHQDGFRPEEPELEVPDLEPGMQVELIVDYPAIKPIDGIDIKSSWRLIHNGHTPFGSILWLSVIAQPDPAQELSSTFEHIPYPSLPPTKDNNQYSLGFTAEIISSSTPPVGEEFTMVETPTPILSLASNDSLFYTPVEGKNDSEDDTESLGHYSDNDFFVVIPSCFKLDVPLTDFEPPINEPLSPVKTPPSLVTQQSTQHNDDTTSTPDIKDDNMTIPPVMSSPETQRKSSNFIPNRETLDQAWISRSRNPVRYALGFVNTVTDLMDQHVHFTPPQVKTTPTTNEKPEEVVQEDNEEDEEDKEDEEEEQEEEEEEQEVPQPSAPPLPIPSHADISNLFQQDPDVGRFLNRKWDGPKQPVTPMDRLISMGFANRALNSRLLKKYNNNLPNVIHELLDTQGEGYQAV